MDNKSTSNLGNLIMTLRRSKGWSREVLAEKSGVSVRTIGRIERGKEKQDHRGSTLDLLAEELGVDIKVLLDANEKDLALEHNQTSKQSIDAASAIEDAAFIDEEPPITNEGQSNENFASDYPHQYQQNVESMFLRSAWKRWALYAGISLILAIIIISTFIIKSFSANNSQAPFQGAWISPTKGDTVHDIVQLVAYAAPDNSSDPQVDHVIFTAWWRGVNPNKWVKLCYAYKTGQQNIFRCTVNLHQLHALAGSILLSFDVYDKYGHVRLSPDNEFTIHYLPSSISLITKQVDTQHKNLALT